MKLPMDPQLTEAERIARCVEIMRRLYLRELAANGYDQGFDFGAVDISITPSSSYAQPRYFGWLQFKEGGEYVPHGVKYEAFFEVEFVVRDGEVEVSRRQRDHYLGSGIAQMQQSEAARENKGPYPGIAYFAAELARLDASLRRHRPVLRVGDAAFTDLERPLGDGIEQLRAQGASFYEVDADRVLIYLPIDDLPALLQGVTFVYDIVTGQISELTWMPPPALA